MGSAIPARPGELGSNAGKQNWEANAGSVTGRQQKLFGQHLLHWEATLGSKTTFGLAFTPPGLGNSGKQHWEATLGSNTWK